MTGSVFSNKKGAIAGSGELLVQSPDTFAEGLGSITGVTVLVNGGNRRLPHGAAPEVPGAGTIETEGVSTLVGAPSAGQTLEILGFCSLNATLSAGASFTDNGAIVLSSTNCGNNATLALPAGDTLTIGSTGSLAWDSATDAGGAKSVSGNLVDDGTIGNSNEHALGVTGTLTFGSGGKYAPDVTTGSSDSVTATGGGTLNGTLAPSGTFTANQNYTILGGVFTGSFSGTNGWAVTVNPTNVTMKHS